MANSDVIDIIISTVASSMEYLLPIIGVMIGIFFVISFLYSVTFGAVRKMFRD